MGKSFEVHLAHVQVAMLAGSLQQSTSQDWVLQGHAPVIFKHKRSNPSPYHNLAAELGAGDDLCGRIRQANTARHVLEMCKAEGFPEITSLICRKVVEYTKQHAGGALEVEACLVDFDGAVLGRYPEEKL